MKAFLVVLAAVGFAALSSARADQTIASAQQKLKDDGFYYGEITGAKDADTTAALRRYQIRNGLKITGELNAETQKSLGVKGAPVAATNTPAPVPRSTPAAIATATPDTSDLRDDGARDPQVPVPQRQPGFAPDPAFGGYAPGSRELYPAEAGVFDGTPYQAAPAEVQRQVLMGVQSLLARQGFYRSAIDGVYGPGTAFALRAYQSRFGLLPSGRLDVETLAALGVLPGQRGLSIEPPRRRVYRPRVVFPGPGEGVYIPR